MPLGTLRHNAELVKRNFINLRTAWGSLFHLLSPVSLSYYSSFHLWLFLFSPHDSLLSWFVFPLLKTIFFSCSLCHTFSLHLLLSFFSLVIPINSWPLSSSVSLICLFRSPLHFTSLWWCFLSFHICIPEEIKFFYLESYTFLFPILSVLPLLTLRVIPSHPTTLQTFCILAH